MTESPKTNAYKRGRQKRISLDEYRKATETQRIHQSVCNDIELQNAQRIGDEWQNWRKEILNGYRYAPFMRHFNSATRAKMMTHIRDRINNNAIGPSEAEASFIMMLEIMEARKAFMYESTHDGGHLMSRLSHSYNYHLLKAYVRTIDMDLLYVMPFRYQEY